MRDRVEPPENPKNTRLVSRGGLGGFELTVILEQQLRASRIARNIVWGLVSRAGGVVGKRLPDGPGQTLPVK